MKCIYTYPLNQHRKFSWAIDNEHGECKETKIEKRRKNVEEVVGMMNHIVVCVLDVARTMFRSFHTNTRSRATRAYLEKKKIDFRGCCNIASIECARNTTGRTRYAEMKMNVEDGWSKSGIDFNFHHYHHRTIAPPQPAHLIHGVAFNMCFCCILLGIWICATATTQRIDIAAARLCRGSCVLVLSKRTLFASVISLSSTPYLPICRTAHFGFLN